MLARCEALQERRHMITIVEKAEVPVKSARPILWSEISTDSWATMTQTIRSW